MSFRHFNSNFRHAALAGLVCLGFAQSALAGDGARDIEIVPFHSTIHTNFDPSIQNDAQNFSVWKPTAPSSATPAYPQATPTPLPRPQQPTLSKEEQQLIERRRNWVFMTPEDYATADPKTDKNSLGGNNTDDNMTAMERYYHHLEQSNKPSTTNEFSQLNPDRLSGTTNFFDNAARNTESGMFGQTPFNAKPDTGVFQPIARDDSGNIFGVDSSVAVQNPEEVREQTEQKAHMEYFKQLWNIDQAQAASAAIPVTASASGPIDSAPLFGAAAPGIQSPFKPSGALAADGSSGASAKPAPTPQPVVPPRSTTPPHSDFAPTQRPF